MNDSVKLNCSVHVYHLLWFSLQTLTQMPRCSQSWASLQQSADLRWWKMLTLAAHLLDTSLSLVSNASVKGLKTNQTVFHWAVFLSSSIQKWEAFWLERREQDSHRLYTVLWVVRGNFGQEMKCITLAAGTLSFIILGWWLWLHSTLTTLSNHQTESGLYNALNIFSFACSVASQWAKVFVNNA